MGKRKKVIIDPEGTYSIHFDWDGEDATELPFAAGELWSAKPVEMEGVIGYYEVVGGAGGWELKDNIRQLQKLESVGDTIAVMDEGTGEVIADDWGDLRELGLAKQNPRKRQKKLAEWGFDLTSISASNWKVLLKRIGARTKPMRHPKGWFIWEGKAVSITTANNPISGEYYDPALRGRDKGYASYIGITGEPDIVLLVVQFIKDHASGIKDESPGEREFI